MPRILLQLLAKPRDVRVDGAVEGLVRAPLREIEELLAREDAAGPLGEDPQQHELRGGELEQTALELGAVVQGRQLESADADVLPRWPDDAAPTANQRPQAGGGTGGGGTAAPASGSRPPPAPPPAA